MSKKPLAVNCPSCKAEVIWSEEAKYRPFCSERCQQKDFCSWANEEHVLPGSPEQDDLMSEDITSLRS